MALRMGEFLTSKSKMASFTLFTGAFWGGLQMMQKSENEIARLAAAGALVTHTCELSFYLFDTVNSKSKVH